MPTDPAFEGRVNPRIALALLGALRHVDTPTDAIEHEAFSYSLPRRLGLSDVIAHQIHRYEMMRDRRRPLPAGEFADLVRLLGRRDDAEQLFGTTGRTLVRERIGGGSLAARLGSRVLPRALRWRLMLRNGRRMARAVNPAAIVTLETNPPVLTMDRCLLARAGGSDAACGLLGTAFALFVDAYVRDEPRIRHVRCEARGEDRCVWHFNHQDAEHQDAA